MMKLWETFENTCDEVLEEDSASGWKGGYQMSSKEKKKK